MKVVSKGAGDATNQGKYAPFDMRSIPSFDRLRTGFALLRMLPSELRIIDLYCSGTLQPEPVEGLIEGGAAFQNRHIKVQLALNGNQSRQIDKILTAIFKR